MLSTVLKLLIVQVLIGMFAKLVHNIYKLWKIQIRHGKQLEISRELVIKAVKSKAVAALISSIALIIILSLMNYILNSGNSYIIFRYKYEEMQSGLNPNKTKFQVGDILCDDVLNRLADKLGMKNVSESDIDSMRDWFNISYANEYQDLLDATSTPKLATEYVVRTTSDLNLKLMRHSDILYKNTLIIHS